MSAVVAEVDHRADVAAGGARYDALVAAGLVGDVLVRSLAPSIDRTHALRVVALAVPAMYFAFFFAALALTRGVWCSVPLWSGTIVLAGTVGWLASWLMAPPAIPGRTAR